MNTEPITIRMCTTVEAFEPCVDLQRRVWNFSDLEVVSSHVFSVASHTGGLVMVAYAGERAVGFASAFAGWAEGRPYLHSDMVAVLPEYQNRGVGRLLKLRQREEMLKRTIELIEWTFDPLALKNARFNLVHLGVVIRRFIPNAYGMTSSPLHANLPTDRLVSEWWLNSRRVENILAGASLKSCVHPIRISIPAPIDQMRIESPAEAEAVQAEMRLQFQDWFKQGYAVTGFELNDEKGTYLLEPWSEALVDEPKAPPRV